MANLFTITMTCALMSVALAQQQPTCSELKALYQHASIEGGGNGCCQNDDKSLDLPQCSAVQEAYESGIFHDYEGGFKGKNVDMVNDIIHVSHIPDSATFAAHIQSGDFLADVRALVPDVAEYSYPPDVIGRFRRCVYGTKDFTNAGGVVKPDSRANVFVYYDKPDGESFITARSVQLSNEQTSVDTVSERIGGGAQNITHSYWIPGKVISQLNDLPVLVDAPSTVTGSWITLRKMLVASGTTSMRDATNHKNVWMFNGKVGDLMLEVDAINLDTSAVDSRYSYSTAQFSTAGGYSIVPPGFFNEFQTNTYEGGGEPILGRSFMGDVFSLPPPIGSYPGAGPVIANLAGMTAPDPWPEDTQWYWPIPGSTHWSDRAGNGALVMALRMDEAYVNQMTRFYNASDPNTGYAAINFAFAFFDCYYIDSWKVGAMAKVVMNGIKN